MRTVLEPGSTEDLRGLLLDYLAFYRGVVAAKARGCAPSALRGSQLPSGWTPAGLITHLTFMERRWLQWGFEGEAVSEPWGDRAPDGRGWRTPPDDLDTLLERLDEVATRTRVIVEAHDLSDRARPGGRFPTPEECPQLHWILLHVLQEYARHAGHLDIVRELEDGATGEEG